MSDGEAPLVLHRSGAADVYSSSATGRGRIEERQRVIAMLGTKWL